MGKLDKAEIQRQIEQLQLQLENAEAIEAIEELKDTLNTTDITENFDAIKTSILEIASKFSSSKPDRKSRTKKAGTTPAKTSSPLEKLTKAILGIGAGRLSQEKADQIKQARPIVGQIADELNIEVAAKMDESTIKKIKAEYSKRQKGSAR